jgi:putative ABC transport system substrate-binding protein
VDFLVDVEVARNAARLVVRVISGHPAGNLSIERPIRFELIVNIRTATALGIKIPNEILVRADKIIE